MSTASPALVRVHYTRYGNTGHMAGHVHARQDDDRIALVVNPAAWQDSSACCWLMPLADVTRIEVLDPGHQPTLIEEMLAAVAMTARERLVYDALAATGGPVQFRDVEHIVRYDHGRDHLDAHQITAVVQSLKAKGRLTLTHSADGSSGVVAITGAYPAVAN